MFDRAELEIAIGITLIGAIVLGWFLHVLWRRLSPAPSSQLARIAVLSRQLHEAEEARDEAAAGRSELEERLAEREAEHQRALDELEERLTRAAAEREAALERQLRTAETDRDASMDGLRAARQQIAELEGKLANREG